MFEIVVYIVRQHVVLFVFFHRSMTHKPRLPESDKVKIIIWRFTFHRSLRYIARKVKCNFATVQRVCTKHKHHVDTERLLHHGRSNAVNAQHIKHLFDIIRHNDNITSEELRRHFLRHDNVDITSRTIRNYRRNQFHPVKELLIPRLKL